MIRHPIVSFVVFSLIGNLSAGSDLKGKLVLTGASTVAPLVGEMAKRFRMGFMIDLRERWRDLLRAADQVRRSERENRKARTDRHPASP